MAEHSNTSVTVKSNSSLQTETEAQPETTDEEQSEKAVIPILICESTNEAIPLNLENIVATLIEYGGSSRNKTDLLISVMYILMLETGFIPKQYREIVHTSDTDFNKGRVYNLSYLPRNWKNIESNTYKFEFILIPFPDRVCKMSCIVINHNIIVNLLLKPMLKLSTHFNTYKYITSERIDHIPHKFCNLNELSVVFKNEIAVRAKDTILTLEGIPHASLQDLPTELMYNIFKQQEVKDFLHLKFSCRRMKECANFFEHELWKHYFLRDYPSAQNNKNERWDVKYKQEYEKKRKMSKAMDTFIVQRRPYLIIDII